MTRILDNPDSDTPKVPNCQPEDRDQPTGDGLLHDMREIARDEDCIWYRCPRCGASEVD